MSDILPCPFCKGEVKRQELSPDMMLHVGERSCVFALSAFTVEKWNRRTHQGKSMDPVTDYILKAEPEDLAEICEAMGTTPEAEAKWVGETIKSALAAVDHPQFCDKAEDKKHYFPNNRNLGRDSCIHCGRTVKEAFERGLP